MTPFPPQFLVGVAVGIVVEAGCGRRLGRVLTGPSPRILVQFLSRKEPFHLEHVGEAPPAQLRAQFHLGGVESSQRLLLRFVQDATLNLHPARGLGGGPGGLEGRLRGAQAPVVVASASAAPSSRGGVGAAGPGFGLGFGGRRLLKEDRLALGLGGRGGRERMDRIGHSCVGLSSFLGRRTASLASSCLRSIPLVSTLTIVLVFFSLFALPFSRGCFTPLVALSPLL
mmetsp:Transcript_13371/g.24934  ORF Transcript_13371/g.24934 Transcript_13371/m.24934 type:complete len:227 (+) Transcript_13371:502-1182(+)